MVLAAENPSVLAVLFPIYVNDIAEAVTGINKLNCLLTTLICFYLLVGNYIARNSSADQRGERYRLNNWNSLPATLRDGSQLHRIQKTTENIHISDGLRRIVIFFDYCAL